MVRNFHAHQFSNTQSRR